MPKPVQANQTIKSTSPACNNLLAHLRQSNLSTKPTQMPLHQPLKDLDRSSTRCTSTIDDISECSTDKIDKSVMLSSGFYNVSLDPTFTMKNFQQSHKYKTEICKNFEIHGFCKWGADCCFAHGRDELRNKTLFNYFYKTKVCKHFHKNGFCPYASRCQYFHFKTNQIYQELLDSLEKKLLIRMNEDINSNLHAILDKSERNLGRLPVFKQFVAIDAKKSLYERFLEDCY